MPTQRQSGGDSSANFLAGRDINYGISASEARAIAKDVFESNFIRLRDVASEVAYERAEKITRDFLDELQARNPAGLGSVRDPDMLHSIFNAQKGYALSGDDDLEKVLVDLLVDRSGQIGRDIKTLVLNEAIATLPKLSADQRSAIAITFLVKRTRFVASPNLDDFYRYLQQSWVPFVASMPSRTSAIQHIEYAGAGSVGAFTVTIEEALATNGQGIFTKGFSREVVEGYGQLGQYVNDETVFIPCLRNQESMQFNALSAEDLQALAKDKGADVGVATNLAKVGVMSHPEIKEDVISRIPALAPLFDQWNSLTLSRLELTTVGVAIGHSYWRQVTGNSAPLEIWL